MITQKKKIKKGERARKYIVESSVKKNIKKKIRKEEGAVNRNGWIGREKEIQQNLGEMEKENMKENG